MSIYHWIFLTGFGICFLLCLFQFLQIMLSGKPIDPAQPRGKVVPAIAYSFTGAMSPLKKETAYLHLPTYTAGIIFHLGTFLSFFWLVLHFFNVHIILWLIYGSSIFLITSSICGLSIFIKRILNPTLRNLSHPDDYFSNLLITGFQTLSAITLLWDRLIPSLFLYASILFLYIPLGKLRHTVYFFTSRIHLGIFYGRRGVWPLKKQKRW